MHNLISKTFPNKNPPSRGSRVRPKGGVFRVFVFTGRPTVSKGVLQTDGRQPPEVIQELPDLKRSIIGVHGLPDVL